MAYTRPWTRQEERTLRAAPRAQLRYVARQIHRSPGAVLERWKRLHRDATRVRKHHDGVHGTLPKHVSVRDPNGTHCLACGQDRLFLTDGLGRTLQECRCGKQFIARRRL